MLRLTFAALQGKLTRFEANAMIETFALHARILMDFYLPHARGDDAIAAHFTAEGIFVGHATAGMPADLRQKINKQITHLTYSRMNARKLNPKDRATLITLIEMDHAAFKGAVASQFRDCFAGEAGHVRPPR